MKTTKSLFSPKGVITYFLSNAKNVMVISNACVRVVIDEEKNYHYELFKYLHEVH